MPPEQPAPGPAALPWRVGRKVGRTIYAVTGEPRADDERLIGVMDTPELAAEAVEAHNQRLETAAWRGRLRREAAETARQGARRGR